MEHPLETLIDKKMCCAANEIITSSTTNDIVISANCGLWHKSATGLQVTDYPDDSVLKLVTVSIATPDNCTIMCYTHNLPHRPIAKYKKCGISPVA